MMTSDYNYLPEGVYGVLDSVAPIAPLGKKNKKNSDINSSRGVVPSNKLLGKSERSSVFPDYSVPIRLIPNYEDEVLIKPTFSEVSDEPPVKESVNRTLPYPDINYEDIDLDDPNIKIDNLIDIDAEDLQRVISKSRHLSEDVSKIMLHNGSANLMSLDNASAYTETALRDGLGVSSNIDTSVSVILGNLLELKLLTFYIGKMEFSEDVSKQYLEEFIKIRVADVCADLTKKSTSAKYSSALRNLAGRVKSKEAEAGTDGETAPAGVVKQRSTKEHNG